MATKSVRLRGAAGRVQTMAEGRGLSLIRFEGDEFHLVRPFLRKRGFKVLVVGDLQKILDYLNIPTTKSQHEEEALGAIS